MKIKKLVVKGFMRFREQTSIAFPENQLILVLGENGAGKTSLIDAMCICLYGRTMRTSMDSETGSLWLMDLVNHDSTKASIHIEFENHGHNYVVRREIGKDKSDGELLEDGELKTEGDAVYEYVGSKAIGLDWGGFSKSTVILQGEMSALTDVLPATRRDAFMKLFGLSKYGEYARFVMGEIEDMKVSASKTEAANEVLKNEIAKIPQVENSLERLKKTMANLEHEGSSWAKKVQQIAGLRKRLEKEHREYLLLNGSIESINKQRGNLERMLVQRKDESKELNGLKKNFPTLERSYKEFAKLSNLLKALKGKKTSYDATHSRLATMRDSLKDRKEKLSEVLHDIDISRTFVNRLRKDLPSAKQMKSIKEQIVNLEKRKVELEESRHRLQTLLQVSESSFDELKEEMAKVKRKHVCPVCSQKLPDRSAIKHYVNAMNGVFADSRKKKRELNAILMQLKRVNRTLGNLEAVRSKMESMYSKHGEMIDEIKRLETLNARAEKIRREIAVVNAEIYKYNRKLAALHFNPREYSIMESKFIVLRQEKIAERYSSTSTRLKRLPIIKGEIDRAGKAIASLETRRKELLAKIKKFGDIEHRFAAVKEELQGAQQTLNQNKVALAKEQTNYRTLARQYSELRNKEKVLQGNEDKIERLQEEVSLMEELMNVFANIPENVLNRLMPHIEKEGTAIVNDLTGGVITALNIEKETLNIGATMGGEIRPIQYFSGGQQTRINMALRVAISRILSRLTDGGFATMQTLIIDEGDFGNLDEAGIRDSMNVLQNLAKEFSRVILLNHLESVRENFRGYTIEVIKTGPSESTVSAPVEELASIQPETV
jgi:exonuclease SbcC